jgi:hypothetical protein
MNFEKMNGKTVEVHAIIPAYNNRINCDGSGNLKGMNINGKRYQRISSQCQNRAFRENLEKSGYEIGERISGVEFYQRLEEELIKLGADEKNIRKVLPDVKSSTEEKTNEELFEEVNEELFEEEKSEENSKKKSKKSIEK